MNIDSCFKLGQIIKAHGLKGEVLINLEVNNPEDYQDLESVFLEINQKLVPFFIEDFNIKANRAIIKFEDIDSMEAIKSILNANVFVPLDDLVESEGTQFNLMIGCKVHDKTMGLLGVIKEVYEVPGQDLLSMDYMEKEILIPVNEHIILKLDQKKKILHVDLPDGLVDLYLNEDEESADPDSN
jgi:16S rRNA processing protein RimM